MNDLSHLEAAMDAFEAEVAEVIADLDALKGEVGASIQPQIDALVTRLQTGVDAMHAKVLVDQP